MGRASPERAIQVAIVKALRAHCPYPWFAVPNGGHRHIATARKLKAEGVRPGVPDLVFCLPGGRFAGLELKASKGRLSEHQRGFCCEIVSAQGLWAVARSIDDAWGVLAAWGCLPSEVRQ
jgi:hypothetical protein